MNTAAEGVPGGLRFDGRAVLVTGAGRGLGAAYATAFADRGAHVVVNDVDAAAARHTAAAVPGAVACPADVSTPDGAASAVRGALDRLGRLDVVVANAGASWHRPVPELTATDLDTVLGPNLHATFHVVIAAWPHLVERAHGRIVTTASAAVFGFAGRAHYAAAKGAVLSLTATLALEGAAHGIHTNCVLPWADTRLARPGSGAPDPALAAPPVLWLAHHTCTENGAAFLTGGSRISRVRMEPGAALPLRAPSPEAVRDALATD